METRKLVEKINEIEMPEDMQERLSKNCRIEMEGKNMNKNTTKKLFQKPLVVAASFALVLCLTGVTAMAATGKLDGFFKDITRWDGAITGTTYEQATDEVELRVVSVSDELTIELTMLYPDAVPYRELEQMGVHNYKITDENGNVVVEGEATESVGIVNGKVCANIPLNSDLSGAYKLSVTALVGSKKADQPLVINGTWECEFVK